MAVVTAPPLAPTPLFTRLARPRPVVVLILLIWLPLVAYVMFGRQLGNDLRSLVLLPAIPAALIVYAMALRAWRESWVAVLGVSLVFLWVLLAVTAPYLPLIDP